MLSAQEDHQIICLVAALGASPSILETISREYHNSACWLNPGMALELGPFSPEKCQKITNELGTVIGNAPVDFAITGAQHRRKKLLVSDMDSTMITIECIDELAALVGKKNEISAITERTMAGELDFASSLIQRVRCLEGVGTDKVDKVCRNLVKPVPGAAEVVATMKAAGARTMLLSGGFTVFTSYVTRLLGFDEHCSNELICRNGKLTGEVSLPVFGAESKRSLLRERNKSLGLNRSQSLALGDGANDIPMFEEAGLGIAYRGKAKLKSVADVLIEHTDLKTALYVQGYHESEIVGVANP